MRSRELITAPAMIGQARPIVVNVGGLRATDAPNAVLATYALGSCIGVAVFDPHARVGGLLHCQLPESSINPQLACKRPGMFADTGMNALIQAVTVLGAQKRRLRVWIAGAAQMLGDAGLFDIGRRNHAAIRKILWQNGLFIRGEHIGGTAPRTMFLKINDGSLVIRSNGREIIA